ncbi:organic hydroperoxide resistance protein [Streptomyces sp. 8K308]|uniref:organic hydroperoxide resistance protein n=1 Tax=Streptomyces sp. 8K308 TaxID=2530388 RepID=UPI0010459679|nr:organic hydroperoxide resistance protein [Streptomyces sp. 8K308]TDC23386.1 organic hydroperoxide resistance protein [Streptomyces sp. 8K308]
MEAIYTAAATANGRDGRAVSTDGQLDLALALPPALGGDGKGTNPEQLFAAGYAACFSSALAMIARGEKIDVSEVSVTAEVTVGKDEVGFGLDVALRVELPEGLAGEPGEKLVERAHQVCPYSRAVRGNVPVTLIVE